MLRATAFLAFGVVLAGCLDHGRLEPRRTALAACPEPDSVANLVVHVIYEHVSAIHLPPRFEAVDLLVQSGTDVSSPPAAQGRPDPQGCARFALASSGTYEVWAAARDPQDSRCDWRAAQRVNVGVDGTSLRMPLELNCP